MSHTPGPWNVCERWPYQPDGLHIEWEQLQHMWIVGIRPGSGIAAIDNAPRENGEANARLIAAAPDLLEASEQVYETLKQRWGHADAEYDPDMLHAIRVLGDAIAKAKGAPSHISLPASPTASPALSNTASTAAGARLP